ncbi:MAG: ImmA/IrrE family metallo-endopeptidase [bacterium]|nr:ImmA/IrrE family metallo-endopeptidase [bacterium]
MSKVAVTKEVLRWALNRSELSEDGLQKKMPKIHQWLTGESQPTLRQLETLAKATYTPLGFFFLEEPPQDRLPIQHFRTLGDEGLKRPSPNLLETIQTMQRRQSWMREFLIEQGQEGLPYIKSARLEEHPKSIAKRIKNTLGLDDGWAERQPTWTDALSILREALENTGILVVVNGVVGNNTHRKLDPNEFRGFVLVDEYAPLVFINGVDSKAAQMFTLAHEVAHVFFGSSAAFDLREMQPADDPIEQACNRVAAEFLVPENELRKVWGSIKNAPEPFQAFARHFKVSELVAARRALDLTLLSKEDFIHFYDDYTKREYSAPRLKGGDFYATQNLRVGRRFASTVIRATKEGKLLYSEAYQLTGLYGNTFESYASHIEMAG